MAYHSRGESKSLRERFGFHAILGVSFGGSKGKNVSSSKGTRTSKQREATGTNTRSTSNTQLLDKPIRAAANQIVRSLVSQQMGTGANAKDIDRIGRLLEARADDAYREQQDANALALAQAERAGQKTIERLNTQLAADAGGSTKNSFVAGATAEATVDLQTNLAALGADLEMKARNLQTAEYQQAIEAFAQSSAAGATDANAIAQLVGVLRGANAKSSSSERGTQITNTLINDIVREHNVGETEGQKNIWDTLAQFTGD